MAVEPPLQSTTGEPGAGVENADAQGTGPDTPAAGPAESAVPAESPAPAESAAPPESAVVPIAPAPPEPPRPPPAPPLDRPRRLQAAPAQISLDRVDADDAYRIRPPGEITRLAQSLARLGQLFPVDLRLKPPDRFQVICGFRRVEALRFLQRDQVVARLHTDLTDEEALLMALSAAIDQEPVPPEALAEARERLEAEGRLTPAARDMLDRAAFGDELAPEMVETKGAGQEEGEGEGEEEEEEEEEEEQEIEADELAGDVTFRLAELNQDLALLVDVFGSLEPERRRELLRQLSYAADLVAYLESR